MKTVKTRWKMFVTVFILMVGALNVGYLIAPDTSSTQDKINECLYASESAYPNWDGPGLLLDNLSACKGLSEASKAQLRTLTKSFVDAYVAG